MVAKVTPALIDTMISSFRPDPRVAFFTHTAGGAVKRVDELATAFPHRKAETMVAVAGFWNNPDEDEAVIEATRAWFSALEPHTGGYDSNIEYERPNAEAGSYGRRIRGCRRSRRNTTRAICSGSTTTCSPLPERRANERGQT